MPTLFNLLGLIGMVLAVFWKPLGLPEWMQYVGWAVALTGFVSLFVFMKRHKSTATISGPRDGSKLQRIRRTKWLCIIAGVTGAWSSLFWIPYTSDVHLGFPVLCLISAITSVILVAVFLIRFRQLEAQARVEDQAARTQS